MPNYNLGPRQREYDQRRREYAECLMLRVLLKGEQLDDWMRRDLERHPVRVPGEEKPKSRYEMRHISLCDVVADVGFEGLWRPLESVRVEESRLPHRTWVDRQRKRLDADNAMSAMVRCLAVRAEPEREPEIFGWESVGMNAHDYWQQKVDTTHMEFLLETADFGAQDHLRLLYMLGQTPAHFSDEQAAWRKPGERSRAPHFPEAVEQRLRAALTEFKYWLDDPFRAGELTAEAQGVRDKNRHEHMEPEQEMTFWSENHRILFATAEYLAGQYFPDETFVVAKRHRKAGPTPTPNDVTGREHMARARPRVLAWLNEKLRLGFAEWNAAGYYEQDVIAILNLADFAVDEEIRTRAAMVLDLWCFDLARFQMGGAMAASAGRAYFETKSCVLEQSVRDSMELLFGKFGAFVERSSGPIYFATSPRYMPAEAVLAAGTLPPAVFTDRSRVSIDFGEAGDYGIGFESDDDIVFWWSRAAYATKQTVKSSMRVANKYGLEKTPPFKEVFAPIKTIAGVTSSDPLAAVIGGAAMARAGFAVGGIPGAIGGAAVGAIAGWFSNKPDEDEIADAASVIAEGSVLSRANLYFHRMNSAALGSVANFRAGQLNFQSNPCIASLGNGAMVWTSYPSAGSKLDVNISLAPLRGALFALGSDNDSALANAEIFGKKPLKDIHIEAEIFKADSHDGPNWWTGNAVQPRVLQQRGAAIIAYKAKTLQKLLFGGRTHAWFPKFQFERTSGPEPASCNAGEGRWFFGAAGDGYLALFSAQRANWNDNGPWKDKEILAEGSRNFFILQIGNREQFGSFEMFKARVRAARIHVGGLHGPFTDFECSYDPPGAARLELHYDNDEARSNGMTVIEDHFPRFRNPFARVAWRQDRYAIQHGDASLTHDIPGNRRIEGARLTELVHAAPLRFYTQNMGLLANVGPVNLYKGFDRDDAIDRLAAILREKKFDVVGLSEFFEADERQRLLDKVGDLYPFRCEGPHEGDIPIVDVELAGGGLFLLSRHRITRSQASIYRQYSGDDGLANKGVLHACIEPVGFPCGFDLFLSHTQAPEPTVGGSVAGARNAVMGQIAHLSAFIDSCRDPMQPALLMGDLNVDFYGDRPLYDYLMRVLNGAVDLKPTTDNPGVTRPDATSESDHHDISSFHEDHPARDPEDEARFSDTTQRLDYVLSFPGRLYVPGWGRGRVVINQISPGRDLSDHYGIEQALESITQRFPAAEPVQRARVTLAGIRCLQTTSGPGDDEVSIGLSATGGGSTASVNTGELDDMSAGSERRPELAPLFVDIVQGELVVSCSGKEHDDLSADDSLGSSSIVLESDELASLRDAPLQRVMPLLRGDGGEYAVRIVIAVE